MDIKLDSKGIKLLTEVKKAKEFYPSLIEDEESALLRRLARFGLIRWCPYPEEFYVITALGKKFIEEKINE